MILGLFAFFGSTGMRNGEGRWKLVACVSFFLRRMGGWNWGLQRGGTALVFAA